MKKTLSQRAGEIADAPNTRTPLARAVDIARAARQAYLQVFGIPDYERYVTHMEARHPSDPVLSRREFFARSIDRKYCRSGPRCC